MYSLHTRKFGRVLSLFIMTVFILSNAFTAFAAGPQVVAAPGSSETLTFEQGIEAAVLRAFDGLAEEAGAEVVAAITPEVEAISAQMQTAVSGLQQQKADIEVNGFVMDESKYPPQSVIDSIPDQAIAEVREQIQGEIEENIAADFAKTETQIQAQVTAMMISAAPEIVKQLEPAMKALTPKIHQIIDERIDKNIEAEIMKALPDLMPLIPAEMQNMSPEEIAAQMKAEIKPKVEAQVRPEFEAKMKAAIDALMVEKMKAPIEEQFAPKMESMDASVYNGFIDQLPSYLERVISKDFIKSVVSENVAALQAKLPGLVESSRAVVDQQINDYIETMINEETKIYIGDTYVEAPIEPQFVNSRLLVPFRAIATALGAEVEWRYQERQVVMTKGDTTIVLTIDSNVVLVNGEKKTIDTAAEIYQNYTIVPLRFIAETFNMDVNWQSDWKMVNIEAAQ